MAARLILRLRASAGVFALATALAAAVAGCTGSFPVASQTQVASTTAPADAAIDATRAQLDSALHGGGFALIDYRQPYQPPETSTLRAAPRSVFQVVLPDDPAHGVVVVYDLGDPGRATTAGAEYARYLAGGPIRVQFPPDTRFVLRQLGSTLVFYTWSAANSPGSSGGRAADILDSLGQGFSVA